MMDIALLIPVIRQVLQIAGGFLIARGWLDDGAADALIGIIVNAIVFGWWLIDRHRINKKNRELKQVKGGEDHA
ncbi:hypothetical protein [Ochrobactrum sp. S1502_03]|uniref:Pam3-gp28 family putative phage holin n=1 Tax=Ochrobactrum sp. S1502_03 TaxID=3108451 RepID=UPI0037C92680